MADTKALGEQATAFAKQAAIAAESTQDFVSVENGKNVRRSPAEESARLYAKAAEARAALDAENASPVADDDAYNYGRVRGPADRAAEDAATAANESARLDAGGAESRYQKTYPTGHGPSYYDEKGRRTT